LRRAAEHISVYDAPGWDDNPDRTSDLLCHGAANRGGQVLAERPVAAEQVREYEIRHPYDPAVCFARENLEERLVPVYDSNRGVSWNVFDHGYNDG